MPKTPVLPADDRAIRRAGTLLAGGGLVAFPTETVYGLGANARDGTAVARVFEAKGRPSFNPLIVHVSRVEEAMEIAEWSGDANAFSRLWPGPLTLVLPLRDGHGLSPLVTAGLNSVALRVPNHPVAQKLLRAAEVPVAAPSANPSGRLSPTRAAHVAELLDGRADLIIDGGPTRLGVESTIVSLLDDAQLLRPGGAAREMLEAALGRPLGRAQEAPTGEAPRRAPGQLTSHYAPRAALRLNAEQAAPGEMLIGFGEIAGDESLSPTGNLLEAAARLFDVLHRLDMDGAQIAVAPIPEVGIGVAINDRLRRAAAPRD
ncbi:MAG: L-threonylcarbamoyladenylate synthase [Pseudomonadota bacterium]